jgi:hypothetical protein
VRDGGYGELPGRMVVTDFPDVPFPFDAGPPIGGGISGGGAGGSDPGAADAGASASDAAGAADTAPAGNGSCSVLLQDCGATRGCYPAGGGTGACTIAGDLGANTPCGEHTQCAPGLLCVDAFGAGSRQCQPACDITRANSCRKGDSCRPYAGTLGFCAS